MPRLTVTLALCLVCSGIAVAQATAVPGIAISGRVLDPQGRPLAGARVFCEPGIAGALRETRAGQDGAYTFDGVPPDNIGVFAIADGYAFGGTTLDPGTASSNVDIELLPPASLSGIAVTPKKQPIPGAHITRVGLLGRTKVGIPLAKLAKFGFPEPISDDAGRFTVPNIPEGGTVALKVGHADFAQEAMNDIPVGTKDLRVTMYTGVLLEGTVVSRTSGIPVAGVDVMVRNAQPPHDTSVLVSNASGTFSLRLKPGVYACQAVAPSFRSAGWTTLTLTGEDPLPKTKVFVAGVGQVRGRVCDAVTSQPIPGARIVLNTQGNMAAVAKTNASGDFALQAMAGQNEVRLEAAPGYNAPEQPALTIQVGENKETQLPTFWLVPIPSRTILIVDDKDTPVPGVIVTVLRPEQFGWRSTDAQGQVKVQFASLPPDGTIVGLAEHRSKPLGALFALKRDDSQVAKVQLLPLGTVLGRIATDSGAGIEGVAVAAVLGDTDCPVWRTVSGPGGTFRWDAVVPQVSLRCTAYGGSNLTGWSEPFDIADSATKDIGTIAMPEIARGSSWRDKTLEWYSNRLIAGQLADRKEVRNRAAVVAYCSAAEAPMCVEGMTSAKDLLGASSILFAVVVDGPCDVKNARIPVLSGKAPGAARTYVTAADGKVVLETFGMPPMRTLSNLAP